MLRLLPLVLIAACSDYDFVPKQDDPGGTGIRGDDSGRSETDDPTVCPTPDTSRGSAGIDETCELEAIVGTWNPVVEWRDTTVGNSYATPVIGHLTDDDGDGTVGSAGDIPDIVVVGTGGLVTALSGNGSGRHWQVNISSSEPPSAAIGDLDGDGWPEVVTSGSSGFRAFRGNTGAPFWTSSANLGSQSLCGGVAIHDLNADGQPEVIQGATILNGQTGTLRGRGTHGMGTGASSYYSMGVAADVNQDGVLEVVVGNALYDANGTTVWANGQSDGFVAVANFDSDPYGEIVVTWSGNVRLQDHDGRVLWSGAFTNDRIGPPTVADFDGDGSPEIGVAGHNAYVVIETDGSLKWRNTTQDYSSGVTGSAVFDFEGDGAAEVVYADEVTVWVYDGATGSVKMSFNEHSSATCTEYPAIADVDNDGHAEIVFVSDPYGSKSYTGLTVIGDADDSWMDGSPTWNQHAWWITNVEADGSIPPDPDTNWLTFNNFRSGDLAAGQGGLYPDAIPEIVEVCTRECDRGLYRVVTRIGNGGMTTMPAGVPVSVETRIGGAWVALQHSETSRSVEPGETTGGMVFDLDPATLGDQVRVVAGEDSTLFVDCHTDNNVVVTLDLCP